MNVCMYVYMCKEEMAFPASKARDENEVTCMMHDCGINVRIELLRLSLNVFSPLISLE